jgi:hypothetical protein
MRIWSLHPCYLDAKGLVALWRETLLAKHVLLGKTRGYKNHPQLNRFKKLKHPVDAIDQYLIEVLKVANERGYQFDDSKISKKFRKTRISITEGQLDYEIKHLLKKLEKRDTVLFKKLKKLNSFEPHLLFKVVPGEIEAWEIV